MGAPLRSMLITLGVVGLLLLALPCTAAAAQVSMATTSQITDEEDCNTGSKTCGPIKVLIHRSTIRLTDLTAQPNDVSVTFGGAFGPVTLRDAAGALAATSGCEQVDPATVRCTPPPPPPSPDRTFLQLDLNVNLGDGNDRFTTSGTNPASIASFPPASTAIAVLGGTGNDSVDVFGGETGLAEGGPGNDSLNASFADGGEGDDLLAGSADGGAVLSGGPGSDRLTGGAGDDTLAPGPGPDTADGRAGGDVVDYTGAADPVAIDLRGGRPEATGTDADLLTAIENARGGSAGDRVVGNGGPNVLEGDSGADDIKGGGGNDEIDDGAGKDRVSGGLGKDTLTAGGGGDRLSGGAGRDSLEGSGGAERLTGGAGADRISGAGGRDRIAGGGGNDLVETPNVARVSCGPGRDTVGAPSRRTLIAADCERVDPFGFGDAVPLPALTATGARFVLKNFCDIGGERCRITVTVSFGGRVLGRRRATVRNRPKRITVGLSAEERRLARRTAVAVAVRATGNGETYTGRFRVRLR